MIFPCCARDLRAHSWLNAFSKALLLTAILLPIHSGIAANLYWDVDPNTAGLGGDGPWMNGAGNWSPDTIGTAAAVWNNAPPDPAFFQGPAGAVVLSGPITAASINFL